MYNLHVVQKNHTVLYNLHLVQTTCYMLFLSLSVLSEVNILGWMRSYITKSRPKIPRVYKFTAKNNVLTVLLGEWSKELYRITADYWNPGRHGLFWNNPFHTKPPMFIMIFGTATEWLYLNPTLNWSQKYLPSNLVNIWTKKTEPGGSALEKIKTIVLTTKLWEIPGQVMLNGHQGNSFSETQMVGNCMEVCTTTKKKSERE